MIQIGAIQVLRALAALMVVFSHAQNDSVVAAHRSGAIFTRLTALPWDAGVDLFFVISGFIMVHASHKLFATKGAGFRFFLRRLVRIVPLYWLMTLVGLCIAAEVAWLGKEKFPDLSEILASLSFLPHARGFDGQPRPIVAQGWTLNYEMFFYVIFAFAVAFRRSVAVTITSLVLGLTVVLGLIYKPSAVALAYWSDPIILEFIMGMAMALLWHQGLRLPVWLRLGLASGALWLLARDMAGLTQTDAVGADPNGFPRVFGAGLPMAMLFAAAVLSRRAATLHGRGLQLLALAGDASYALYLSHPFVIILVRKAYLVAGVSKAIGFWPLVAAELTFALIVAVLIHWFVEKPMIAALRRQTVRPASTKRASAAGGFAPLGRLRRVYRTEPSDVPQPKLP